MKRKAIFSVSNLSEGAGSSVTAIHLADSLARSTERRVLLIDLDFFTLGATRHMKTVYEFDQKHSLIPDPFDESVKQENYFNNLGAYHTSDHSVADLLTPMRSSILNGIKVSEETMDQLMHSFDEGLSDCVKYELSRQYEIIILDLPKLMMDKLPRLVNEIADFNITVIGDDDKSLIEYETLESDCKRFNILNELSQEVFDAIAYAYPEVMKSNLGGLPEVEELLFMNPIKSILPLDTDSTAHYDKSMDFIVHELMTQILILSLQKKD